MATKAKRADVRETKPARVRKTAGMDPALFDELLEAVREGGRYLRGEATPTRVHTRESLEPAPPRTRTGRTVRTTPIHRGGRGSGTDEIDVGALRARLALSQTKFAALLGISPRTLEGWEQGRRQPDGPARMLLRVAAAHPEAVLDALIR